MKIIALVILLLIMTNCGEKENHLQNKLSLNKKSSLSKTSSYVPKVYKNAKYFSDIFDLDKIIDLETTKESLLGNIETIILLQNENRIIIHDAKNSKILLFDFQGKFVRSIGQIGEGPGEMFKPNPIAFGSNKLVIYSKNGKLLLYNLEGDFIKEINLRKNKWQFLANRMTTYNNDLYVYSRSKYLNFGKNGKRNVVFKITNFDNFDFSYGKPQETVRWGAGDITTFNNRIIYTGIFNGKIYRIFPTKNKEELFADLGELYDVSDAKASKNPTMYLVNHIKEVDAIEKIGEVKHMLFVLRTQSNIAIIDSNGIVINDNIQYDLRKPEGYEGNGLRLACEFYTNGILLCSTKIDNTEEGYFPNPSILFYKLK